MNFDQDLAKIRDSLPRIYWAMYQGCIDAGFTPDMAAAMTQTWILSQAPHGVRCPNCPGKQEE